MKKKCPYCGNEKPIYFDTMTDHGKIWLYWTSEGYDFNVDFPGAGRGATDTIIKYCPMCGRKL